MTEQKCTRCNGSLDRKYFWHIPICSKCRGKLIAEKDFCLTKEEQRIVDERFLQENTK